MTSRLYVRKGGDIGAGDIELTGFTGRKGIPFFDDDTALIKMGMRCENGEASQGTFKLMDPEAELPRTDFEFNLPAHTLVTWTEDAPGAEIWLARGRIAQYEGGRGDVTLDNQVEFDGLVDDGNMELRGQAFTAAWVRPAETDFDRIAALRAYTLNGSGSTATEHRDTASVTVSNTHLCPNTNTVSMPAKTYPVGTQPQDVITDCADTAGKIYGVVIHHTGGSHLCLLYILETNHTTFATAAKISDELADWDPEDATAPVYEPHWEAGKASIYDGQPLLSGLVSIYGTDQSVFVDNANATPYDYWVDSYYDSVSVTPTQAAAKASGLLLYRSLTHVTHRVSVIMLASQLDLIHAGMSIQIKSAAAMGGQFLDTYQTRRIAECQFEPRIDGTYWAHLSLDRTPHTPKGGKAQPAATTPKPPPVCAPDLPGTAVRTFDFEQGNAMDVTQTFNSNHVYVASSGDCPSGSACVYNTASHRQFGAIPVTAGTAYVCSLDIRWKYPATGRDIDALWFDSGSSGIGSTKIVLGAGHATNTPYSVATLLTAPVGAVNVRITSSPFMGSFLDNVVWSTPSTPVDNDPDCVPVATWTNPAFMAPYDDTRFAADDQHVITRTTQRVINNSGVTLDASDVVVPDLTLANAVTRTTTAGFTGGMVGVVVQGGDDDAEIVVQWSGHLGGINVNGVAVAVGDYVYTSTTAGVVTTSPTRSAGAVGRVVSVDGTDPTSILWWGVPDIAESDALARHSQFDDGFIGHRFLIGLHGGDIGNDGDAGDSWPQGSMEGHRQGALKGADYADVDCRLTSDGVWVSYHDSSITAGSNGSGTISAITAATFLAAEYDSTGIRGYNASRHGTTVSLASVQGVINAVRPYGMSLQLELKPTGASAATSLAQLVVANAFEERVYIHCIDDDQSAAVKAVSTRIMVGRNGPLVDPNCDIFSIAHDDVTSLAVITAAAPLIPSSNMPIADFGDDETTIIQNMYDRGIRMWTTNYLDVALAKRAAIYAAENLGGAADHGGLGGLADDDHPQYVKDTEFGAKGRILVGTASGTFDDLPVGTNTHVLTADSAETTGMKWVAHAGGSTHFEVLLTEDGSAPITTEDGLDWLYVEVAN